MALGRRGGFDGTRMTRSGGSIGAQSELICFRGRQVWVLVEVVDRCDKTVAIRQLIRLIIPEAAEARRRGRLTRPLHTRQGIRGDVANPTGGQHGDDVSGSRMSLAHAQRNAQRLVEEVAARHGDEELKHSVAPQHRLGTEPAARHFEHHLTAADEHDAAVGDDHACRQVDVIADQEHLAFPDDAVGLQRPPDGATRPADRRHIAR